MSFDYPWLAALLALIALLGWLRARAAGLNERAASAFGQGTRKRGFGLTDGIRPGEIGTGEIGTGEIGTGEIGIGESRFGGMSSGGTWRAIALFTALAAVLAAAMQPRFGASSEQLERRGRDIMVLLDVSQSMLAEEAGRTRLDRGLANVERLARAVETQATHRLGLIAFAGRAQLMSPLTTDTALFRQRLAAVREHAVPLPGSHLGHAIRQALHAFGGLQGQFSDIIVVSDGEDHGSAPLTAADNAAGLGVALHALGVGNAETGAPVPAPKQGADDKDAILSFRGTPVISRMDPNLLARLAQRGGGAFADVRDDDTTLERLFEQHIASKPTRVLSASEADTRSHRFQWLVALALALLALEMGGPALRSARLRAAGRGPIGALPAAAALVLTVLAGCEPWTSPASAAREASARYHDGDYAGALSGYEQALTAARAQSATEQEAILEYNAGVAAFSAYHMFNAYSRFIEAVDSNDATLAARVRYNLGNVRYQQALSAMQTFGDAVTPVREAAEWFRAALERDPGYEDARYNLELALLLRHDLETKAKAVENAPDATSRSDSSGFSQTFEARGGSQSEPQPASNPGDEDNDAMASKAEKGNARDQAQPASQAADSATPPAELTPEQAEELVELVRGNAKDVAAQRMVWRRSRLGDATSAKPW